ncbi:MAG: ATP-binding cassette domain-containing protein, partial [Veillonellaceae bacterium]|nr:ATP-binding cassette domain-containing protein [Veillonellaceae bacterium]
LYFVLSLGLCLSIVNIYVPIITQVFMDDVLTMKHRPWLFEIMLGMAIALFLQMILHFFRSWCLLMWQGSLALRMCSRFFEHVLRLPIDFFQQRFTGDIVSRLRLGEEITTFVTGHFAQVALDFLVAMLYLVLLVIYDPLLTAFGVVFTCGNLVLTYFVYQWLKEQQMRIQLEAGRMSGLAAVGIASIESLKANGIENDFFIKWVNKNARYLDMLQHQEYIAQFVSFIPSVLAGVNSALIMMLGGFEIMDGVMTVGIFVAFQNLMSNFQQPVGKIAAMLQNIQQTEAQILKLEDISRYTALPEKKLDTSMPSRLKGHVEMRNVSYAYGRVGRPLIKRLNFEIKPGRRLAIVGKSGSGKSTTAKLVSGLCQPWLGEIYYDGIPLGEINQDILANSMSVVEQNPVLLEGTVAENISLFDANISRQEIIQAAKDACIHEEIAVLRGGYDFLVAEGGANFSGGQRQRLEIARALATNPSFLVFDEATAELDAVTEKKIMDNIRRRGCSCLIVAHRLSTIRDCDEIIVLSNGRVVERGNHDSLMAKDGHYKKLLMEQ